MARQDNQKRTRLVRPYPADTLESAKAVAEAVGTNGTGGPEGSIERNELAKVLGTTPKSSTFTTRLNSSAKYGLTLGGYNDDRIRLTSRGVSVVAPTRESERMQALRDAALEPDVFSKFYENHDGMELPVDTLSKNLLQRQLGIRAELAGECLDIIKANGTLTGLIKERRGKLHVDLATSRTDRRQTTANSPAPPAPAENGATQHSERYGGRVFVGHWGDPDAARFVTKTLADFQIPYAYLDGLEPDGRPVHAKIAEEMHKSAAAILVFAAPEGSTDSRRDREQMIYQLGASSVLFGDKVVVFQCAKDKADGDSEPIHPRSVIFQQGKYDEAGYELIRELHQSGIIRVGV